MAQADEVNATTVLRNDTDQIIDCWPEMDGNGALWFVIRRFKNDVNKPVTHLRLNKSDMHRLLEALVETERTHGNGASG